MKIFKIIFFIFVSSLSYQKSYSNIEVAANYAIMQDHYSGKVLYEKEADIKIYPASMTKIMTTIIVFDLLQKGEISLDEKITISENAWRMSQSGYSSMFIMLDKSLAEKLAI